MSVSRPLKNRECRLTAVIDIHNAKNRRPDQDQGELYPAPVKGRRTPRDGKDVVSGCLDDIMYTHGVDRTSEAEQTVNDDLPTTLSSSQTQNRSLSIQGFG